MVSVYPEDSSRALKVCQEYQQVGRVAHQVPTFGIGGTIISRRQHRPVGGASERRCGRARGGRTGARGLVRAW
eukprot:scaffold63883_cov61-Phaeocystis_antarctica.AAC.1